MNVLDKAKVINIAYPNAGIIYHHPFYSSAFYSSATPSLALPTNQPDRSCTCSRCRAGSYHSSFLTLSTSLNFPHLSLPNSLHIPLPLKTSLIRSERRVTAFCNLLLISPSFFAATS